MELGLSMSVHGLRSTRSALKTCLDVADTKRAMNHLILIFYNRYDINTVFRLKISKIYPKQEQITLNSAKTVPCVSEQSSQYTF